MQANGSTTANALDLRVIPPLVWVVLVVGMVLGISWLFPHSYRVGLAAVLMIVFLRLVIRSTANFIVTMVVIALLGLLGLPPPSLITDRSRNCTIKTKLSGLSVVLYRYATNLKTEFPIDIKDLRETDYIVELVNPYYRFYYEFDEDENEFNVRQMQPLGQDFFPNEYKPQLEPTGNFCYLPEFIESDEKLAVTGVRLVAILNYRQPMGWLEIGKNYPYGWTDPSFSMECSLAPLDIRLEKKGESTDEH